MQQDTNQQKKPVAITETYDTYLRTFSAFHFLTGEQLTRRLYKMGMRTTVMARLKLLTEAGYLHAFWLPTVKSKSPYIYTLAAKGVKYLRDEGLDVEVSYKPSELAELSHSFLWHILELNDFLISAYLLERAYSVYRVQTMLHDLDLKKHPIEVPASGGRPGKPKLVIPDAFIDIRMVPGPGKKQRQYGLWVELDRGTEQTIEHFRQKIRSIVAALVTGKAQEYFAIRQIAAVVFPTTGGEKRVEQMRKWTMEVLTDLRTGPDIVDLFLFTAFTASMSPEQIFFVPLWAPPRKGQTPVSLLGE